MSIPQGVGTTHYHGEAISIWGLVCQYDRNTFGTVSKTQGVSKKSKPVPYSVMRKGYPFWIDNQSNKHVFVHQLTAIMGGADPYDVFDESMSIHHKNGCKFDNRPDNLQVMSISDHSKYHYTRIEENIVVTESGCEHIIENYGNMSLDEIASDMDVSPSTVWNHLSGDCHHHDDDHTQGYDGPRDGQWRDYTVFHKEYVENERSIDDLADEWGCSIATVSNWKDRHDINHNNHR